MKVFIWEEVLYDWGSGLAVAYAETLEQAFQAFPDYIQEQLGAPTKVIDCDRDRAPYGTYVYGG